MTHTSTRTVIFAFATIKATAIALVTFIIGTAFWQSLVIATVSGCLGMAGMILAAWIAANATRQNRQLLERIEGKTDTITRRTDRRDAAEAADDQRRKK